MSRPRIIIQQGEGIAVRFGPARPRLAAAFGKTRRLIGHCIELPMHGLRDGVLSTKEVADWVGTLLHHVLPELADAFEAAGDEAVNLRKASAEEDEPRLPTRTGGVHQPLVTEIRES